MNNNQLELITDIEEALGAKRLTTEPNEITEKMAKLIKPNSFLRENEMCKRILLSFYGDESIREKFDDAFSRSPGLIGFEILPSLTIHPRGVSKTNILTITVPAFKAEGLPPERMISENDMKTNPALKPFGSYEHFKEGARQWAIKRLFDQGLISAKTASEADYRPSHPDLFLLLEQQKLHPTSDNTPIKGNSR